jgi:diaminohydroxyphosphoribosylaminopyrimidine deaminase/5-amino-6-(5-phosphoribosylamino)uracil reductase
VRTGLPWVCIKLAQTSDGRIATAPGESRWISSARSRAVVHTERGRVDAILTGMGTVLADNPLLTVRGVRARRTPMRVVWDPRLQIPLSSQLVRTAAEVPLVVGTLTQTLVTAVNSTHAAALRAAGVRILAAPCLRTLLSTLHKEQGVSRVLVEAGAGLVGALLDERLAQEAWVFTAPRDAALPARDGATPPACVLHTLRPHQRLELVSRHMRGADEFLRYLLPT